MECAGASGGSRSHHVFCKRETRHRGNQCKHHPGQGPVSMRRGGSIFPEYEDRDAEVNNGGPKLNRRQFLGTTLKLDSNPEILCVPLTSAYSSFLCSVFALNGLNAQSAEKPAYLNPSLPAEQRAADLVHRMTLDEKATQLVNQARAIPRLNVPAYDWWSEALHGVARTAPQSSPSPSASPPLLTCLPSTRWPWPSASKAASSTHRQCAPATAIFSRGSTSGRLT